MPQATQATAAPVPQAALTWQEPVAAVLACMGMSVPASFLVVAVLGMPVRQDLPQEALREARAFPVLPTRLLAQLRKEGQVVNTEAVVAVLAGLAAVRQAALVDQVQCA